jgi:hypothetical protein
MMFKTFAKSHHFSSWIWCNVYMLAYNCSCKSSHTRDNHNCFLQAIFEFTCGAITFYNTMFMHFHLCEKAASYDRVVRTLCFGGFCNTSWMKLWPNFKESKRIAKKCCGNNPCPLGSFYFHLFKPPKMSHFYWVPHGYWISYVVPQIYLRLVDFQIFSQNPEQEVILKKN